MTSFELLIAQNSKNKLTCGFHVDSCIFFPKVWHMVGRELNFLIRKEVILGSAQQPKEAHKRPM